MSLVIGLTGGIGSGKSSVTALLEQLSIPIIDTDQLARDLVKPDQPALNEIVELFGKEVLLDNGHLDRAKLRTIVFNQAEKKQQLEAILHPKIQAESQRLVEQFKLHQPNHIVVAIPLLVEGILKTGNKPDYIDQIWVVDCSEQQQIERASSRDNNDKNQIQKIVEQQVDRDTRLKYADQTIDNSSNLDQLKQQVFKLINRND